MSVEWFIVLCFLIPIAMLAFKQVIPHKETVIPWENFDRLSDEDFVALCRPGVKPETALKVREIIADQLAVPPEQIHPEHRLVEDLLAD